MADDRLIKLLSLTQSSNDHEALVAIRKANERRIELGKTWGELFSPPPPKEPSVDKHLVQWVDGMIEFCLKHIKEGTYHHLKVKEFQKKRNDEGLSWRSIMELKNYYDEIKKKV